MIRRPIKRGTSPKIMLHYIDASGEESLRLVSPIALSMAEGERHNRAETYLQAKCSVAKANRTFRFDRIRSISDPETGEVFDLISWAQRQQLGNPQPFDFWDDELTTASDEMTAPAAPEPPSRDGMQAMRRTGWRWIIAALLIGYAIGRFRLIHALLKATHQHWGKWL